MRTPWLSPFRVRSFRFQWPSDLATSWAFEMEILIVGWYILVATGSVVALTAYAALLYIGTLIAPMIGTVGDRIGHRNTLALMRATYAAIAATILALTATGNLSPTLVFAVSALAGLVRPSDLAMRNALIAGTIPPGDLATALGISRTTMDSAKIAGALAGAGLMSALGMTAAYIMVTGLYLVGLLLTLGTARATGHVSQRVGVAPPATIWRELKDGIAYCWTRPAVRAAMLLAVLVNLTAFPMSNGILPYVARDVYGIDQSGLGKMVASYATGALIGSLVISAAPPNSALGRMMLVTAALWHVVLLLFGQTTGLLAGMGMLFLAGLAQSLSMLAMAVMILRATEPDYRGRVMGVRMLAIYSQLFGLLGAGFLLARIGFPATAAIYAVGGLAVVVAIGLAWHRDIWHREAPANRPV